MYSAPVQLPPRSLTAVPFMGAMVAIHVAAPQGQIVDVFVTDDHNLQQLRAKRAFNSHGAARGGQVRKTVMLPHSGPWHLVVYNPGAETATVQVGYAPF